MELRRIRSWGWIKEADKFLFLETVLSAREKLYLSYLGPDSRNNKEKPKGSSRYKGGKASTMGFLVGQVMQFTKGSANPNEAKNILEELLK